MRVLVFALLLLAVPHAAVAQYCASYYDGTKSCGIPALQACEQSVLGVGGTCAADDTSQLRPAIKGPFQRMFERAEESQDYQRPRSPDLDDVPPPPEN
jgi:hypothetical protein